MFHLWMAILYIISYSYVTFALLCGEQVNYVFWEVTIFLGKCMELTGMKWLGNWLHYLTRNFLIYNSLEHSSSWEANSFSAGQEIPRFYETQSPLRMHGRQPLTIILSQINPVPAPIQPLEDSL
jgi:hypothetical protein